MSLTDPMLFDSVSFWTDEDVQLMSYEEVGVYLRLLSHQWVEGSIPACPRRLSAILTQGARHVAVDRLSSDQAMLQAVLKQGVEPVLWHALQHCFEPCEDDESRLQNPRLAAERETWLAKKRKRSEAGKKGGKATQRLARKRLSGTKQASSNASSDDQAMLEQRSSKPPSTAKALSVSVSESVSVSGSASLRDASADLAQTPDSAASQPGEEVIMEIGPLVAGKTFAVTDAWLADRLATYAGTQLGERREMLLALRKANDWLEANPPKRPKTAPRFLSNWLSREHEQLRKAVPSTRRNRAPQGRNPLTKDPRFAKP